MSREALVGTKLSIPLHYRWYEPPLGLELGVSSFRVNHHTQSLGSGAQPSPWIKLHGSRLPPFAVLLNLLNIDSAVATSGKSNSAQGGNNQPELVTL